jgi:excisionase family DNA binding protein
MTPVFYTVNEIASILRIHRNTVEIIIKSRKLTATKIGGVWRISQIALDSYLNKQTITAKN